MRYYSIFSGIEAASVAWGPIGWEPLVFSENDKFPCAVLAERYPDVPNLGDITEIDWKRAVKSYGKPDVVVGGSPCQSFSIAGTRAGLDGASGLMWEYVRCVRDVKPDWILWENVPGALSSSHGEDFRCLLEALDALGYGMAWRVLDAQFFGVAQRRERVFLVGRLGDPGRACQVLFEPESLSWDSRSSREKRKELAAGAGRGASCAGCLNPEDPQSKRVFATDSCGPTLSSGTSQGMDIQPSVLAFAQNSRDEVRVQGDGQISGALSAQPGMKQTTYVCETAHTSSNGLGVYETSPMTTLDTNNSTAVAVDPVICMADDNAKAAIDEDMYGSIKVGGSAPLVARHMSVRRFTPRECERLQGFPDDWTLVPYRGKASDECPDTPRYKAIGNSMAVPVMRWIGGRIDVAERGQ